MNIFLYLSKYFTIFPVIVFNNDFWNSRSYSYFKQYLMNGHETPMAYYYNTLTLLAVIRTDETNEALFTCTDERGMEFSYRGSLLKDRDITKMINDLHDRYKTLTRTHAFFGEPIPHSLSLLVNIREIIDNLQNIQPGYSFLDDPRNSLEVSDGIAQIL